MLLTCAASSIADLLRPDGRHPPRLALADVPRYVKEELGLHGLVLSTELLVGSTRDRLTTLRDRADKSRCACLALFEPGPLTLAAPDADEADAAVDRLARVVEAASLLGCNAAGFRLDAPDHEDALERAAANVRRVMDRAERAAINVIINPAPGLTASTERLTELVKKIGGFRIGTLPDFQAAAADEDPQGYLKRITPYASVVFASTIEFGETDTENTPADDQPGSLDDLADLLMADTPPPPHLAYPLEPLVAAVAAVGFDGTLAIDYRGEGDGTLGVLQSRDALESAIQALADA